MTHPTPELLARTLAALDTLHARDAGCPRLDPRHALTLRRVIAHSPVPEADIDDALDHLNTKLGEVQHRLMERDDLLLMIHPIKLKDGGDVLWCGRIRGLFDSDYSVFEYYPNELTAKCEVVVEAAVASGWEGKVE